uniref:Transcription factor YY2 (Trinotate prediction) n=1 Tax=Myxobolus squamalis TaxID=59785 RepID=A0A6B2FZS9_MYXSQ
MDIYRLPECPIVGREVEVITEIYNEPNITTPGTSDAPSRRNNKNIQFKVRRSRNSSYSSKKTRRVRKKKHSVEPNLTTTVELPPLSDQMSDKDETGLDSLIENPVKCTYKGCKRSFKDVASLRKHINIHGPKNFICPTCGKSFVENSKLKRHSLVHSGEKPFKVYSTD